MGSDARGSWGAQRYLALSTLLGIIREALPPAQSPFVVGGENQVQVQVNVCRNQAAAAVLMAHVLGLFSATPTRQYFDLTTIAGLMFAASKLFCMNGNPD